MIRRLGGRSAFRRVSRREKVPKDHPRVILCGTIDEANAALGLARATTKDKDKSESFTNFNKAYL